LPKKNNYEWITGRNFHFWDFVGIPLHFCRGYAILLLANAVIASIAPSLLVIATAGFIDAALEIFNGDMAYSDIFPKLGYISLIALYQNIQSAAISQRALIKIEMSLTEKFRSALAEKRARLKYCHIEDNDSWDIITRVCRDPVDRIMQGNRHSLNMINIAVRVLSLMALVVTQAWWAAVLILAVSVPLFYLSYKGGQAVYKANQEAEGHMRKADYLHRALIERENVEERALFAYANTLNDRWKALYEKARSLRFKADIKYFTKMKLSSFITVTVSLFVVFLLALPLVRGDITIGMYISLVGGFLNLVDIMSFQLSRIVNEISEHTQYLKDLSAFSALSEQEGALEEPAEMPGFALERIEFKDVSFAYPGTDRYVLDKFNLIIHKGLHYAIVGVNGAGKTTVTKLLTGLYDNYEGEIRINGKELRQYALAELKRIFSVVLQDYARYGVSLRENIRLGDVRTDDTARMESVLDMVGMGSMAKELKNGLYTNLGKIRKDGTDISSGQWQRISIARALYADCMLRILDEPTAALDPVAESDVYEMFGRISAGMTTIFITHRLGAARLADEIVVMEGGRVAEKGAHSGLIRSNGIYAKMFESQRSWYI